MTQEDKDSSNHVDALAEINAMKKVAESLENLDDAAIARVLRWALERYGHKAKASTNTQGSVTTSLSDTNEGGTGAQKFGELAEFYAACGPSTDAEKALVVGYWQQFVEGNNDLDTQRVNTELKQLGHAIGNITRAFDNLAKTRPQLVIQTRKSGTTQQARKKFKLTVEGKRAVETLMSHRSISEGT